MLTGLYLFSWLFTFQTLPHQTVKSIKPFHLNFIRPASSPWCKSGFRNGKDCVIHRDDS
jgi:hypothetical protein